jgi:hypothetical protein
MQLLFYAKRDDKNRKRLEKAVRQVIPKEKIGLFNKLSDLEGRLRTPLEPDSIAILLASNGKDLCELQGLRELLTEIYVLLVIPDRKPATIDLAHLLLPRFLSPKDDDFTDLQKVLNKMCRTSHDVPDSSLSLRVN